MKSDHGTEFLKELLDFVDSGELSGIKFLVTSQPEPTLFEFCKSSPCNAVCKLHEIDVFNVQKDNEKFLFSAVPDLNSDGQGFVNPHGFAAKGSPGMGRGHSSVTLTKPLPAMQVWGYPQFSGRVK